MFVWGSEIPQIQLIGVGSIAVAGPRASVSALFVASGGVGAPVPIVFDLSSVLSPAEEITSAAVQASLVSDSQSINFQQVQGVLTAYPSAGTFLGCIATTSFARTITLAFPSFDQELTLQIYPSMPNIPSSTPLGAIVASLTAAWSSGVPFQGNFTFAFGGNPGNIFAITQAAPGDVGYLIVNPSGPGVGSGGSLQNVLVVANDPPV